MDGGAAALSYPKRCPGSGGIVQHLPAAVPMKLSCSKSALAAAFGTVSGVVPARSPKEILKNVKLALPGGGDPATLSGTDQEIGVRAQLAEVESGSTGELLLPTARFGQILREVPSDTIELELTDEALMVRAGSSEFNLQTEDPEQFPDVADFDKKVGDDAVYFTTPAKVMHAAIQQTIFAVSQESARYALGGVQVEAGPDGMTFASTDGRRLAVVTAPCEVHGGGEDGVEPVKGIIPQKAMQLLDRSINDPDAVVKLAIQQNEAIVDVGSATIEARLVDGHFPDYKRVIPDSTSKQLDMVVSPLIAAVKQAMIVTSDESRGVNFLFDDGTLTLTSSAADVGRSTIQLPIDYQAEALEITFDPKFLVDFLRVLGNEDAVRVELNDSDKAGVFKAGGDYTYVVMPLQRDR